MVEIQTVQDKLYKYIQQYISEITPDITMAISNDDNKKESFLYFYRGESFDTVAEVRLHYKSKHQVYLDILVSNNPVKFKSFPIDYTSGEVVNNFLQELEKVINKNLP